MTDKTDKSASRLFAPDLELLCKYLEMCQVPSLSLSLSLSLSVDKFGVHMIDQDSPGTVTDFVGLS